MSIELLVEIKRVREIIFHKEILTESTLGGLSDELVNWVIKQSDELVNIMGKNAESIIKLSKNFNGASISDQISIIKTIMASLPDSQIIKFSKSFLDDNTNQISKTINNQINIYNENLKKYPNLTKEDVIYIFKKDIDSLFKGSDESLNKLINQIKEDASNKIYKSTIKSSTTNDFYKLNIGDGSKIDFSKITNAKNIEDYRKIIDDAINSGDFSKISKGGFESYGIDNFRVHLMKNYPQKSIDNINPQSYLDNLSYDQLSSKLDNSNSWFSNGIYPESISGWKFHIFGEDLKDSVFLKEKLWPVAQKWGAEAKVGGLYQTSAETFKKGQKQYGKQGATIYIPPSVINSGRQKEMLSDIQNAINGYKKEGSISGDQMITPNIGYRYELLGPISKEGIDRKSYKAMYNSNEDATSYKPNDVEDLFNK